MNETDSKTVKAMLKYGGSFVYSLAKAAQCADESNLEKIKSTWPEYWDQYSAMDNNQTK